MQMRLSERQRLTAALARGLSRDAGLPVAKRGAERRPIDLGPRPAQRFGDSFLIIVRAMAVVVSIAGAASLVGFAVMLCRGRM